VRVLIIKVSEKPVISINTGKALGTLKGFIYKNNKVTFLYCEFSNKYLYIPITDVYIGSDAVMLKSTEDIHIFHTDATTKVYTENGDEIGTVTSIQINDSFNITGILVDDEFIEIDKILHMENVIIVAVNKQDTEIPTIASVHEDLYPDTKDTFIIQDEDTELADHEQIIEAGLTSIQQLNNPIGENIEDLEETNASEINPQNIHKQDHPLDIEIDERYKYLHGKKLLEDITIAKKVYPKDTLIDPYLIQFAINNNSILKVIMNTED